MAVIARILRVALGVSLLFAALAFGAVHEWASAILAICLWGLGAIWLVVRGPDVRWLGFLPLYGALAFQLVPLPPGTLAALSPKTAELYT
ncbi:MAG: hypothetical protein ACREQQ_06495, partial [Candidatus Binatia bacterium]